MCGIAGVAAAANRSVAREDLASLASALRHRGPDGEGIWLDPNGRVGLVHRRLAIIDTSERGAQPMFSGDQRYVITFNGEIYNFLELRSELEALGSRFHSETDTEVIVEGWRHWGEGVLERLNGMWAFALHDTVSGKLFLARDRFGVKPLLYTTVGGNLAFASEMRALTALPWLASKPNLQAIEQFLFDSFSIEAAEATLHAAVRNLPAGHCATYINAKLDVRRWWNTAEHLPLVPASSAAQQERFRELFLDSVRLRMRSDVPIGTCLSGGFDSSAIVGSVSHIANASTSHQREASDWRSAFIAAFPGSDNDETDQALLAAKFAGAQPQVLEIQRDGALEDIDTVLHDTDGVAMGLPTAPWSLYRKLRSAGTLG
jgi:asparagine synthase (glutamine-hydrolysing)